MKLRVWRDPYGCGVNLTKPSEIDIVPGLTVLVGCNGSGKTTLLMNIKEQARHEKVPCHLFDNLVDGGNSSLSSFLSGMYSEDDFSMGLVAYNSSEGEKIKINIAKQAKFYKEFIHEGHFKDKHYEFSKLFDDKDDSVNTKDRILLYDAVDSGMSIDAVQDIKQLFHTMIHDAYDQGVNLYIIISANEFELCLGENCLDVVSGKYIKFYTYPKFKTFIINSRKQKEKRLDKQEAWAAKQEEKEISEFELKKKHFLEIEQKIKSSCNGQLSLSDKSKLWHEIEKLENFSRNCKRSNFSAEIRVLHESLYKL